MARCGICAELKVDGKCPDPSKHVSSAREYKTEREHEANQKRLAQSIQELGSLPKHLKGIYDIMKAKGLDLIDLESSNIERVKFWQSMHKDNTGEAVVTDLQGITLSPGWESGPKWPVVQPAKVVKYSSIKSLAKKFVEGLMTAVVLPDMQIGYYHTGDPRWPMLEPIHDERAIQIALSIIREQQPDLVVLLGDNLDLAEFGKYRQYPEYARTSQASIDRMYALLAEIRSIVPNAKIVWLEGNHEVRMTNMVLDNAVAAYGLRRAGDGFQDAPVMSVPHLLRLDEFDVEYVSGYPGGIYRITKWLSAIHGKYAKSDSVTALAYLKKGWDSVIAGHSHRIERVDMTRDTPKGPRTRVASSPGCLCRIDGMVPSTNGGMDIFGRPVKIAENWQQGLMVVDYDDTGWFSLDQVTIWSGKAVWRGKEYKSDLSDTWLHPTVQPPE